MEAWYFLSVALANQKYFMLYSVQARMLHKSICTSRVREVASKTSRIHCRAFGACDHIIRTQFPGYFLYYDTKSKLSLFFKSAIYDNPPNNFGQLPLNNL